EVGYELYVRMLEEAVAMLKGEAPSMGPEPEMHLSLPAYLPEGYLPDSQVRLSVYRRLSQAQDKGEVRAIAAELGDRFGPPPAQVENLLAAVALKGLLRRLFATRMDLAADSLQFWFTHEARVDLDKLLGLAERQPGQVRVHPDGKVWVKLAPGEDGLARARDFLQYIGGHAN
ncbi:MAG: transcription-repair coupling factor, partial [Desulfovibrio sp.]|nr:transcription-repair coupling factor [Desulfovibrio sp.]